MKVITIHQPWASLIAIGVKQIETRSWRTKYRGALAIHAGVSKEYDHLRCQNPFYGCLKAAGLIGTFRASPNSPAIHYPYGAVVATAEIFDCVPVEDVTFWPTSGLMYEACFGDFEPGRFAWLLKNVEMLKSPVPAIGKQGLWEWEAP